MVFVNVVCCRKGLSVIQMALFWMQTKVLLDLESGKLRCFRCMCSAPVCGGVK
uniref:Uncharacterized protein n=1 Tax=Octopus bimaculoides TaxID=37653 RepID=A0A0L8G9E1_OCTBM